MIFFKHVNKGLATLFLLLGVIKLQATVLTLTVIDSQSKNRIPARVLIKNVQNESFTPDQTSTLKIGDEVWFISSGYSKVHIASDKILLRVERGKEYKRVKKTIILSGKDTLEITVVLNRWINMKEKGYLSAENHLHLDAEEAAIMCAAEDLDFGSSLQWWNRPRFGVPEGLGNERSLSFADAMKMVSVYDVEVEEAWGALYLINLPHPFPLLNDKQMPNLIAAKYGHEKNTLNCYQAGWSREVLVDALLGYVDVINVCNNNFHMHRYQPRSFYSNLLQVADFPVYPNSAEGMMQMNMDTYYRLLNCGLKLAAGAGSATGVKEVPAGYNRTYVKSSADTNLVDFLNDWKKGKNFVTNGPMLFFKVNETLGPGDSLNISGTKKIKYTIEVLSDSPLNTVEIIKNGQVVKSMPVQDSSLSFKNSGELEISASCWICVRCTDSDLLLNDEELALYKSPAVKLNQLPSRLRFAHTSPLYIKVDGKEIGIKKSIQEGLKMISAFKEFADTTASAKYRQEIMDAALKAKDILEKRLNP